MGVNMTLYQAGGYENLPKQLRIRRLPVRQFRRDRDRSISESGLDKEFAKGVASGKPIISTINPVSNRR